MVFAGINLLKTILRNIYPTEYAESVLHYSEEYGIDPYLVFAVIKAESGFDPDARSRKNALGLMQITEKTALWGAEETGMKGFVADDLFVPDINIKLGCWYLDRLMEEFDGYTELVVAAYNGGSGNVKKWLNDSALSKSGKKLDRIPFGETDRYVKKVGRYVKIYRKLYTFD